MTNSNGTVLGLDLSLRKAGFCVIDPNTWVPGKSGNPNVIESGRLKTTNLDGIELIRLQKQQAQIRALIIKHNVKFICVEQYYFDDGESEMLYALHMFAHTVFMEFDLPVICLGNQVLKKVAWPERNATIQTIEKPQMIAAAKKSLGIVGASMVDDVADAYWAMHAGVYFYHWNITEKLKDADLGEYLYKVFAGKHTYTRGEKKGITEYTGVLYRENELYFNYKKIKERISNVYKSSEESCGKSTNNVSGGSRSNSRKISDRT